MLCVVPCAFVVPGRTRSPLSCAGSRSECIFTIQEAEASLDNALHPNRPADAAHAPPSHSFPTSHKSAQAPKSPVRSPNKRRGEEEFVASPTAVAGEGGEGPDAPPTRFVLESPAELLEALTKEDIAKLEAAVEKCREVGGDIRLVALADAVIARLKAGVALADAVAALEAKRCVQSANAVPTAIRSGWAWVC